MNVSLVFFGIGLIFVVLQGTVLHLAGWTPIIPDLTLTLCVFWALNHPRVEAVWATFLLGYAIDILSSPQPGLNALAFSAVFLVVYIVSRYIWARGHAMNAVTVFAAVWLKVGVLIVIYPQFIPARGWTDTANAILQEALLSALIAPFLFIMLRAIQARMETVRRSRSYVNASS
jgi:rod shape-determining protein MreD